jgi:hypothetical protein
MMITKYDEKLKPLYELIKKGDYNAVVKWVKDGNPVYNPDSTKQSALYYASSYSMFSILEFLLSLDWSKYQKHLNTALQKSLSKSNADHILLLLDHGASVDSVRWSNIFDTFNRQIVLTFFEKDKPLTDLGRCLPNLNKTLAGALKEVFPHNPELENCLIGAMIYNLGEMYYSYPKKDESNYYTRATEEYDRYWKQASLIRWIGCDIRKEIDTEDGRMSALGQAIIYNDVKVLKSLKLSAEDSVLINKYAKSLVFCDKEKMQMLIKLGFKVNDLPDGTSSYLLEFFENFNFEMMIVLERHGAKLPSLNDDNLKSIRSMLFSSTAPNGIFITLSNILSPEQMRYIVKSQKAREILEDTPDNIIKNLYDIESSESFRTFQNKLQNIEEELKTIELHPSAKKYQNYCKKADKPYDYQLASTVNFYNMQSMRASKEIRPWVIYILNDLLIRLEEYGVKFKFLEERRNWGNFIDVSFLVVIRQYEIPIEFHEIKAKPKKYLLAEDGKLPYAGKLQFCHRLDGKKNKLAEEKSYFQFKSDIEYLIKRLFSVADLEDRRTIKRQLEREEYERRWRERQERERLDKERRKRIEDQKNSNRAQIEVIIEEEKDFFNNLSSNAKAFDECRLMRQYLQETERQWNKKGTLTEKQKLWISRAYFLINRHDPFLQRSPKSIQDIDFPDLIWEKSWAEIVDYIRSKLPDCKYYDDHFEK